jgi:hypothetical protein
MVQRDGQTPPGASMLGCRDVDPPFAGSGITIAKHLLNNKPHYTPVHPINSPGAQATT